MALNYDDWKKQYEAMDTASQQKFATSMANNDTARWYMQQYITEKNWTNPWVNSEKKTPTVDNNATQTTNSSDFNSDNGTNWQNSTLNNNKTIEERRKDESSLINERRDTTNTTDKTVSGDFKSEKIGENNGISVKEWDASITGLPDYQDDSAARLNEIASNLNSYYQTNKEFFNNRDTFNKVFNYSGRSQTQRDLLDSYWRKVEDTNYVNTLTSADSITNALDSANLTPDQLGLISQMNPELYQQWLKARDDKMNLAIANFAVPADPYATANLLQDLVKRFWLEAWDMYDIIGTWEADADRLWIYRQNDEINSIRSQMAQVSSERTAAMTRVMKEWAGRKSQALINAEVSKTSALYDAKFSDLTTQFSTLYQQRNQNLSIANQHAQMVQAQAQEDSRVFNKKLQWLWFAMQVNSYRTPEQQAQLSLQKEYLSNQMGLYKTAMTNELDLYKTQRQNDINLDYAEKQFNLQQKLNYQATDINNPDEEKARQALGNVLDQYYEQFGDIIKRPKQQVIDDVMALAKKEWISVGEALKKDFTDELMKKDEYKNYLAKNYAEPEDPNLKYQDTWETFIRDDDWNIISQMKWYWPLPDTSWVYDKNTLKGSLKSVYESVWNPKLFAQAISQAYKDWTWGWQCWAFINNVLEAMWDTTHFWNDFVKDKLIYRNKSASETPKAWDVVLLSNTNNPNWHVMLVTWIDWNWNVSIVDSNWVLDKNWKWTETIRHKTYTAEQWEQLKKWSGWFKLEWYYEPDAVTASNPMTWKFLKEKKAWKTQDERNRAAWAKYMYDSLFELQQDAWDWMTYIEHLVQWWVMSEIMKNIDATSFTDDRWWWFLSAFSKASQDYVKKRWVDDPTQIALNKLYTMVEKKLRQESWAAISSSEWLSNFNNYLPSASDSTEVAYRKLSNWDWLIKSWITDESWYIPIFDKSSYNVSSKNTSIQKTYFSDLVVDTPTSDNTLYDWFIQFYNSNK